MVWISLLYIVALVSMVYLSIKLGDLVDLLDKKSKISGAFIGSVLLGAVTSLPELFTSISSILFVKNPSLVIGDIMGSDIFDMCALIVITFIFGKHFFEAKLSTKLHLINLISLFVMYGLALYAVFAPHQLMLGDINIISIVIFIGYACLLVFSPKEAEEEKEETDSKLTIGQILILFFILASLLIGLSISITYLTDAIVNHIPWLSGTAGGAILLGIATSIPEIISTVHLFKLKNYDAGFGNMIGSCTFNFSIMAIADFMSWSAISGDIVSERGIWISNQNSQMLLVFGLLTLISLATFILVKSYTKILRNERSSMLVSGIFAFIVTAFYILTFLIK
ncbi:MAG: hypothetical protein K6G28_06560 [Acholeplasmatales bacterium]|nr:hypothetical protein [Acholeplasmatales bacterium]